MYVICDLAMHIIITKSQYCDVRDFTLDARIPSMYYIAQPDTYQNTQNYLPELYLPYSNAANAKKTGIVVPVSLLDGNFTSLNQFFFSFWRLTVGQFFLFTLDNTKSSSG